MQTPVFESAGAVAWGAAANNNGHTPASPATKPAGSVVLLWAWTRLITATLATPTGWTLQTGFPKTSGTAAGGRLWCFARIVDGSEDAPTLVWTGPVTGTSGDVIGAVQECYSGVDTRDMANLFEGMGTPTDASGTTPLTYPATGSVAVTSKVLHFLIRFRDAVDTFTPSTGTPTVAERLDSGTTNRTGGQVHSQDFTPTAAGVQAARTVVPSVTTASRYYAISFGLKGDPLIALAGDVAGTSSQAGEVVKVIPLDGANTGQGTLDADLTIVPGGGGNPVALDGGVSGASTLAGELVKLKPLAGAVSGTGSQAGELIKVVTLIGGVAGTSALAGELVKLKPLAGDVTGTGTPGGAMVVLRALVGANTGSSALTGDLTTTAESIVQLAGGVSGTSALAGELVKLKPLAGGVTSTTLQSGAVELVKPLAGDVAGTTALQSTLHAVRALTGAITGSAAATGDLTIVGLAPINPDPGYAVRVAAGSQTPTPAGVGGITSAGERTIVPPGHR